MNKPPHTPEQLRAVLAYTAGTGALRWKVSIGRNKPGDLTSQRLRDGYLTVTYEGRTYFAHRVAWAIKTGEWPVDQIDHKNTKRADNRWRNLRPASNRFNCENRRSASPRSQCGLLGVKTHRDKFQARIKVGARHIHLGTFTTSKAAHAAYRAAKRIHHEGNTL